MTTQTLSPVFKQQFFDNNGKPLFGGKLYSYAAGTTSPAATYTDSTGTTPNTNPIVLDYRGECNCWISPNFAYKFVLTDSFGTTIWSVDNVINQAGSGSTYYFGGGGHGSSNTYAVNFSAPFSTIPTGTVVYWVPDFTNTGSATLNVNSTGPAPILTQFGVPASAGQVVALGATGTIYIGGSWYLLTGGGVVNNSTFGSYIANTTGGSGNAVTVNWQLTGDGIVWLTISAFQTVSSANTFTLTNLPSGLLPASKRQLLFPTAIDNGSTLAGNATALIDPSNLGIITLQKAGSSTGWTATGVKGLGVVGSFGNPSIPAVISYPLTP